MKKVFERRKGLGFSAVAVISLGVAVFTSCSLAPRHSAALLERLKNRGPVPLSADNPFLAPNLFLTREVDRSMELRGFLEHQGAPAAIEITKSLFSAPEILLYYPEKKQTFRLEDAGGVWAIRGPEPLDDTLADAIASKLKGEQTVIVANKPPADIPLLPTAEPAPTKTPTVRAQIITPRAPTPARSEAPRPPTPRPSPAAAAEPLDTERLAEISPRGDVVHYVTYDGEDLPLLARWYTSDPSNAERIGRINRLAPGSSLQPGDTVVIPSYLVKNKYRLTEPALRAMQVLVQEEKGQ